MSFAEWAPTLGQALMAIVALWASWRAVLSAADLQNRVRHLDELRDELTVLADSQEVLRTMIKRQVSRENKRGGGPGPAKMPELPTSGEAWKKAMRGRRAMGLPLQGAENGDDG